MKQDLKDVQNTLFYVHKNKKQKTVFSYQICFLYFVLNNKKPFQKTVSKQAFKYQCDDQILKKGSQNKALEH